MSNIVRIGFESQSATERMVGEGDWGVKGEFKMAWLWAEGWRARLRAGGDLVERCRYEC